MSLGINDRHNANHEMRTLIVNDVEKYRLIVPVKTNNGGVLNTLIYAKGRINFDINLPRDGSNNLISYDYQYVTNRAGVYAFYRDGFYSKNTDGSGSFEGDNLTDINSLTSVAADFIGWYTERDGGKPVSSVQDINKETDLFKHHEDTSIPEVTVYAKGEIHKYTVYVDNITRSANGINASSRIKYNGITRSGTITLRDIDYNTEIISYLNMRMTVPAFISGASHMLDRTLHQQKLREGVQSFIGGHTTNNARGNILTSYRITEDEIHIYPQFKALVVGPKVYFPKTKIESSDGYTTYSGASSSGYTVDFPEYTSDEAKRGGDGFDETKDEAPYPGNGSRNYSEAGFPLGSADTAIVRLDYHI